MPDATTAISEVVQKYRDGLAAILGDDLDCVVLYGSQARGDARGTDSDIDFLCVMRTPFDYGELMDRAADLTASLSLQYDVVLSVLFATREKYDRSNLPFYMNVRREGIRV